MAPIFCDILVAGGSAGGTAAALAAAAAGASVCLLEETEWLGGQLTVQGVCTPDENRYIESFGCTRRYAIFRNAVRDHYRSEYKLSAVGAAQPFLNPGSCWVSGLSFEPKVGAMVLAELVRPNMESGNLRIFYQSQVVECGTSVERPDRIDTVIARRRDGQELCFRPQFVGSSPSSVLHAAVD